MLKSAQKVKSTIAWAVRIVHRRARWKKPVVKISLDEQHIYQFFSLGEYQISTLSNSPQLRSVRKQGLSERSSPLIVDFDLLWHARENGYPGVATIPVNRTQMATLHETNETGTVSFVKPEGQMVRRMSKTGPFSGVCDLRSAFHPLPGT